MSSSDHQRVLITGGSGFIGTNLVDHFVNLGFEVLNLDSRPPRNPAHSSYWRQADLANRARLIAETVQFRPRYFLHFAARTDLSETCNLAGYSANMEGICNVIDAIRAQPTIERAVFASTQLVCRIGYQPQDELDYQPTTLYGRSKAIGERIVRAAHNFCPVWTIVRPTSIWGPWFDRPYRQFFEAIAKNRYVHPKGLRTTKQWGFVLNTVYQIEKILAAPPETVASKLFYLCDDNVVALHEFADKVQLAIGSHPIRSVPPAILSTIAHLGDLAQKLGWAAFPLTTFRYANITTNEISPSMNSLSSIVDSLPYSVDQGIDKTVEWLDATADAGRVETWMRAPRAMEGSYVEFQDSPHEA